MSGASRWSFEDDRFFEESMAALERVGDPSVVAEIREDRRRERGGGEKGRKDAEEKERKA